MIRYVLLFATLSFLSSASAQGLFFNGERIAETTDSDLLSAKIMKLGCSSKYCVWHLFEYPPREYALAVSDLEGKPVGPRVDSFPEGQWQLLGIDQEYEDVAIRFIAPDEFEVAYPEGVVSDREYMWNTFFSASLIHLSRYRVLQSGTQETWSGWASFYNYQQMLRSLDLSTSKEEFPASTDVPDGILELARQACKKRLPPNSIRVRSFDTRTDPWILILENDDKKESWRRLCVVQADLHSVKLVETADSDQIWMEGQSLRRICFLDSQGGYKGDEGQKVCVLRNDPARPAYPTEHIALEDPRWYPVTERTVYSVDAETAWHVRWGVANWRDRADLAVAWSARRTGDELRLSVSVWDDFLVPFDQARAAIDSDHLEILIQSDVPPAHGRQLAEALVGRKLTDFEWASINRDRTRLKLGILFSANGEVRVREWERKRIGAVRTQQVDKDFTASGSWTVSGAYYAVELTIPMATLRDRGLMLSNSLLFTLLASDSDGSRRQETLMGTEGRLVFFDEFPSALMTDP